MVNEYYPYIATQENTIFFFESIGSQGKIIKAVVFEMNKFGKWNLGFGDMTDDYRVDSKVISNNQDVFKVISTVAKIAYTFMDIYPNSVLSLSLLMKSEKCFTIVYFNVILRK